MTWLSQSKSVINLKVNDMATSKSSMLSLTSQSMAWIPQSQAVINLKVNDLATSK